MQFSLGIAVSLAALASARLPIVHNSFEGVMYRADLNASGVTGYVIFTGTSNGSTIVDVRFNEIPDLSRGPFPYHIHEKPVPANGSCEATLGHVDPFNGTQGAQDPADLELGDLSGRHGNVTYKPYAYQYVDDYLSLEPGDKSFIGNLSVVFHDNANRRLACGNIVKVDSEVNGTAVPSGSHAATPTRSETRGPTGTSPSEAVSPAGAVGLTVGAGGLFAAALYLL